MRSGTVRRKGPAIERHGDPTHCERTQLMGGYTRDRTGLLFVDPYNDFLSEGGKLWPLLKEIAEEEHLLDHLRQIVAAARAAKIQLFIVPHHRWEPGDYAKWRHPNPSQIASGKRQT